MLDFQIEATLILIEIAFIVVLLIVIIKNILRKLLHLEKTTL